MTMDCLNDYGVTLLHGAWPQQHAPPCWTAVASSTRRCDLLQGSGSASSTWRRDLLQGNDNTSSTRQRILNPVAWPPPRQRRHDLGVAEEWQRSGDAARARLLPAACPGHGRGGAVARPRCGRGATWGDLMTAGSDLDQTGLDIGSEFFIFKN
jgi:hypothetical protein